MCEYSASGGKRDFVGMIKVRILRWGWLPWVIWMNQCNHKGPSREAGGSESEKETWNRSRLWERCWEGAMSMQAAYRTWKETRYKQRNGFSHPELPGGMQSCKCFDFRTSDLLCGMIINVCCFKPRLWSFVTAAMRNQHTPNSEGHARTELI